MECPRCQPKKRTAAKFCDECGRRLPRRRGRRHTKQSEIATAIIVVLGGAALVTGLVIGNPRWRAIIATWRELFAAGAAQPSPATATLQQEPAPHDRLESRAAPLRAPNLARSREIPPDSTRGQGLARLTTRSPTSTRLDDARVMISLLVAQLGQDAAWRTALANANSHAPDSPEFVYWHRVAAAIREGGPGPRR
jgi:hypothetical protein